MWKWWGTCALCAAVLLAATDAGAGRRGFVRARIDGDRFRSNVAASLIGSFDPTIGVLTVSALDRRIRPSRGTVRTLTIVCPVDLETADLPVTIAARPAIYSDDRYSGFVPHVPKTWGGDGVSVTIRSFDGRRVTGTFAGELAPGTGDAAGPAAVQRGRFRLDLGPGAP